MFCLNDYFNIGGVRMSSHWIKGFEVEGDQFDWRPLCFGDADPAL